MSDSLDITYADAVGALTGALDGLERPGEYFASGTMEGAPPLLEVDGVGVVSMPVPPEQAGALAAAAGKAPYGRGDETLIDESVRKVRQLGPDKVRLGGKRWPAALEGIVAAATEGLGRPAGSLRAELHKLLIYEPGGFFLAHRDTEKAPGMLGTLIVVLPSAHAGGELIVRHNGREAVLDLRNLDPGELRYAAFYADCEHEVRPVKDGHRICLAYNLVKTSPKKGAAVAVPDTRPHVEAAAAALREWTARPERADKLVYLLEHRYTEAALSFDALKGADAARARVLCAASEAADCVAHLGMVHIEESGWAEYHGGYGRSRRRWSRWDDDDEQDDDDFEIGEVCDGHRFISQWRDANDAPADYGEIPLKEGEVLPPGALDGEAPDQTHFTEATGNEGASFERTYLRAAIVLWPRGEFDVICASAGQDATLTRLGQRVDEACAGSGEAVAAIGKMLRAAVEHWPDYVWSESLYARFLDTMVRLGDLPLLKEHALPRLGAAYSRANNPALRRWAGLAGPKAFRPVLKAIPDEGENPKAAALMELWCELAEVWKDRADARSVLRLQIDRMFPVLGDGPGDDDDDGYDYGYPPSRRREAYSPDLLARFLHHLEAWPNADDLEVFVIMVGLNEISFPPDDLVLPALEHIAAGGHPVTANTVGTLWRHCGEWLLRRSATPPAPPESWTLPLTDRQLKGLRADLKAFALDPEQKEMRFRVRKDLRQEIHRIIESRKLDMTHVTERRGSPHTLVCTKTLAHYGRACRQYEKDVSSMRRLLRLSAADSPANASVAARLSKALKAGEHWKPAPLGESVR